MALLNRLRNKNTGVSPVLLKLAEAKGPDHNVPRELVGTYVVDFDLLYGDRVVMAAINRAVRDSTANLDKIRDLDIAIQKAPTRVQRVALERQKTEIETAHRRNLELAPSYTTAAAPLLQEYRRCPRPAPIQIGQDFVLSPDDVHRIDIIERWLKIASRYVQVRVVRELAPSDRCGKCQELYVVEDNNVYCPSCFTLVSTVEVVDTSLTDGINQIAPKKKNYDLVGNLSRTFDRIQGTSDVKIPYDDIEKAFDAHLVKYGWRKEQLTKDQIIDMLKVNDFPDFYPDINYIMHMYLGTPLPDYDQYKERVLDRYAAFLPVYDQIEKDRTSALNGQYTIHKLLQLEGCATNPSDFKMTKGYDTLCEYERIWEEACRRLGGADNGWPFISSFHQNSAPK